MSEAIMNSKLFYLQMLYVKCMTPTYIYNPFSAYGVGGTNHICQFKKIVIANLASGFLDLICPKHCKSHDKSLKPGWPREDTKVLLFYLVRWKYLALATCGISGPLESYSRKRSLTSERPKIAKLKKT